MSSDNRESDTPSLVEAEIEEIGCSCWQVCPAYAKYIKDNDNEVAEIKDNDNEVAEIKERNTGYTRLAIVASASFTFAFYMMAEIFCGATGYAFQVAAETKFLLYSYVVAAIGGESAVQAYGIWRRPK